MTVTRDELKKILAKGLLQQQQQDIAKLRLEYSAIHTLRDTFIKALRAQERIYPTILPTQSSGRWSYINPALSGFPKKCINPSCPEYEHERSEQCWSLVDCIKPDINTFWIDHDLDAVEHRIYALILQWKERLNDLKHGIDIHTPVTCDLFNLPSPPNTQNPHSLCECSVDRKILQTLCSHCQWRQEVKWQGKDDTRRTMSKNFTYGQGQYCYVRLVKDNYKPRSPYRVYKNLLYTPTVVYLIPNIESYLIKDPITGENTRPNYEALAIKFMESNIEIQKRKAIAMEKIRKDKIARTLYGNRRLFYFQDQHTAKEGFNFSIQGTVASYINESCILLQNKFPHSCLVHNKHDSLKWAFTYTSTSDEGKKEEELQILNEVKKITQRELTYKNESILITATYKIIRKDKK